MLPRSRFLFAFAAAFMAAVSTESTQAQAAVRGAGDDVATCELYAFRGSAPKPEERDVPLDARILVAYRACGTTNASITLWRRGMPVDGTPVYGWSSQASWATFKPSAPLEPMATYVVRLETEKGSSVISFQTGTTLSPPDADAKPSLRVLDAQFASPRLMPDGRARADFTLELIHPKSGPLGAFYLGGPKRVENSTALVTERLALADGRSTVPLLQTIETLPGEPACFSVLYEDAAGRLSTASEPACAVVPGRPLEDEGDMAHGNACAVSDRGVGAARGLFPVGLAAAALLVARRRRR